MAELIPVIPETDEHKALVEAAGDAIYAWLEGLGAGNNYIAVVRPYGAAREALNAVLELHEKQVRERAAQELTAWAGTYGGGNATQRRMLRHIHMCAQRIAPKPTPEQIAEALARGDFVACHLDDAGRAIPPVDQPEPESSSPVEATNG
jgi:hypothetical protein